MTALPPESTTRKVTTRSPASIPERALQHLKAELLSLQEPLLESSVRGRFCYVSYNGEPLCRLGYRGKLKEWDFSIFKYSTQRYGELELAPASDSVRKCVNRALHAYGFR